ncbi:hypothetical protein GGF38_003167, partial [Coemansia sp. RSA 25]
IGILTDANDFDIGTVLEQERPDGSHPVKFMSKQPSEVQCKYELQSKELFAI